MVSNQFYLTISQPPPRLPLHLLLFSSPSVVTATPPPSICWKPTGEQLVSMRRASIWDALPSPGSLVWLGGMWKHARLLEKAWWGHSFFFVVLGVIVCSQVFLTAANEFINKVVGMEREWMGESIPAGPRCSSSGLLTLLSMNHIYLKTKTTVLKTKGLSNNFLL